MDTIIDKYEDYIKLIQNKIDKNMIGKEYTMKEILGKSIRLIPKKNINYFKINLKRKLVLGKLII